MNIKLSPSQFEELIKKSYSIDIIYMLSMINNQHDVEEMCKRSVKIKSIYTTLIRKQLISEDGSKITIVGKSLLDYAESESTDKIEKTKKSDDEFEKWWKAFPGTDTFEYRNKKFEGSRSLRQNKNECRKKLNSILLEGEYTIDDLVLALEFDVKQKKENSIRTNSNKLTYMQNSLTYLNQRSYESYIELAKNSDNKIDRFVGGPTDI